MPSADIEASISFVFATIIVCRARFQTHVETDIDVSDGNRFIDPFMDFVNEFYAPLGALRRIEFCNAMIARIDEPENLVDWRLRFRGNPRKIRRNVARRREAVAILSRKANAIVEQCVHLVGIRLNRLAYTAQDDAFERYDEAGQARFIVAMRRAVLRRRYRHRRISQTLDRHSGRRNNPFASLHAIGIKGGENQRIFVGDNADIPDNFAATAISLSKLFKSAPVCDL